MHQTAIQFIHNPSLWAKEIIISMQKGELTEQQGKEGLCRLLCAVCGAKEKERKATYEKSMV